MNSAFFRQSRFFLILFLSLCFFLAIAWAEVPVILVTVAPHKFFVEKIAKQSATVQIMVPAGASAHTYEPTAKQMLTACKADIWFRTGEPFENRAIQALKSYHPHLEVVDMRHGLNLITSDEHNHCKCCPESVDLHFWLSARQSLIQAKTIADALSQAFPARANFYKRNLEIFEQELRDLDLNIQSILAPLKNRNIFVSHPAYAYFCRDYGLNQYAVEIEGKDPTPQQMTRLLHVARQLNTRTIFVQMQYNNKAAKLIADTLKAHLHILDPYSEHYMKSMLEIAYAFANQ